MANITKRGNTYRIRVSAGFDGNGKRLYHSETYVPTAKTPKAIEKEVKHYAEILEQKVKDGLIALSDATTFNAFVETWKQDWASEHLKPNQQESYLSYINLYVRSFLGSKKLGKITKKDCIAVVNNMKEKEKASRTIRLVVSAMRSVFKYALYLELINSDPSAGLILPPLPKEEIECFNVQQAQAFLNALSLKYPSKVSERKRIDSAGNTYTVKEYTQYKSIPFQFQLFFNLSIKGGFRRAELLGLTWNDVDFKKQTIIINKAVIKTKKYGQIVTTPKTANSNRTVYVPAECIDMLEAWLDEQKEYSKLSSWEGMPTDQIMANPIFIQENGKSMNLDTPTKKFSKIIAAYNAKIEDEAETLTSEDAKKKKLTEKLPLITLHGLRHTFATILISNGTDVVTVSRLMGHSSPSVTMNVYSHLLQQNAKDAANVFEKLFTPPTETPYQLRS